MHAYTPLSCFSITWRAVRRSGASATRLRRLADARQRRAQASTTKPVYCRPRPARASVDQVPQPCAPAKLRRAPELKPNRDQTRGSRAGPHLPGPRELAEERAAVVDYERRDGHRLGVVAGAQEVHGAEGGQEAARAGGVEAGGWVVCTLPQPMWAGGAVGAVGGCTWGLAPAAARYRAQRRGTSAPTPCALESGQPRGLTGTARPLGGSPNGCNRKPALQPRPVALCTHTRSQTSCTQPKGLTGTARPWVAAPAGPGRPSGCRARGS